jgi:hypothetical protein
MIRSQQTMSFALAAAACLLCGISVRGQEKPAPKKVTGIQVLKIQSDEIKLPAEFQVSLYENLVQQLQKKGGLKKVYRDGERSAADTGNLVVLHSEVRGFKKGSELARNVTTVAGATSISIHCRFTDASGTTVLERDIQGKVRFFGANLRATSDFAKKAAAVIRQNFTEASGA